MLQSVPFPVTSNVRVEYVNYERIRSNRQLKDDKSYIKILFRQKHSKNLTFRDRNYFGVYWGTKEIMP